MKKSTKNKLQTLIREYLPKEIETNSEYQTFVAFMEAFYEYLEQEQGQTGSIRNLRDLNDIDRTIDDFIYEWTTTVANGLPRDFVGDKNLVLKNMKDLFLAKGSEKSYQLLFRILFNDDVQIRYPYEQVLIASGAEWRQNTLLILEEDDVEFFEFYKAPIIGETTGATGVVEKVEKREINGEKSFILYYSVESKEGDFEIGETVKTNCQTFPDISATVKNIDEEKFFASEKSLINTQAGILQDGFFYQKFSYVVSSPAPDIDEGQEELLKSLGIDLWSWKRVVKKLVHPAGRILFNELRLKTVLGLNFTVETIVSLILDILIKNKTEIQRQIILRIEKELDVFTPSIDQFYFVGASIHRGRNPGDEFLVMDSDLNLYNFQVDDGTGTQDFRVFFAEPRNDAMLVTDSDMVNYEFKTDDGDTVDTLYIDNGLNQSIIKPSHTFEVDSSIGIIHNYSFYRELPVAEYDFSNETDKFGNYIFPRNRYGVYWTDRIERETTQDQIDIINNRSNVILGRDSWVYKYLYPHDVYGFVDETVDETDDYGLISDSNPEKVNYGNVVLDYNTL